MTMKRFLEVVERHGRPALPVASWRAEVGAELVATLRGLRWLESRPLSEGGWFPCPSGAGDGCPRRVVQLRGQLVAVCGQEIDQCDDVVIADDDAEVLAVTTGSLRAGIAAAVGLDEVERGQGPRSGPVRLGERQFGDERAAFYFAARVGRRGFHDWLDATVTRERGRAVALLVARGAGLPVEQAAELRRAGVFVLGLDRTLRLSVREAVIDLAEFVIERRFAGVDPGALLWPRYELVLDPEGGRHWYRGQELALEGKRKTAALLEELAAAPGQVVTRDTLFRAMWPESYGGRGTLDTDWDRRIRGHKQVLAGLLGAVASDGAALIASASSGDETEGGYRLVMDRRRLTWWSSPNHRTGPGPSL